MAEFLNNYGLILVSLTLLVFVILLVIMIIYNNSTKDVKSFKKDLDDTKAVSLSVMIDMQEEIVEKYYLYEQNKNHEIISLNEFYLKFDSNSVNRLKAWLSSIASSSNTNRTRRMEVVMFDKSKTRSIYRIQLENYDKENDRYFLLFKDITDSIGVLRRVGKIVVSSDSDNFYQKANERIFASDKESSNFLVAITFKEFHFAEKELQADYVKLLVDSIYNEFLKEIYANDLLSISSDSVLLLLCSNVSNERKMRQHIKKMLIHNSKEYEIIAGKFKYAVTLVGGITKIENFEKLTVDKTMEAVAAANALLTKGRFSERLQLFDANLSASKNILNEKIIDIERVVNDSLFDIKYIPIIETKTKKVKGYCTKIVIPDYLNMEYHEFMKLVKQNSFRLAYYTNVFKKIIEKSSKFKKKTVYFSFDFDDLHRVMETFENCEDKKKLDIYFCVEFSNVTMQELDLITIERELSHYIEHNGVKFAINYNTLSTLYLNAKIYSKANVVLLSGQLIEKALEKYSNSSLIDVYTKVAKLYNQEVIGLNVSSTAIYEMLFHHGVRKMGGSYISNNIELDINKDDVGEEESSDTDRITNKAILAELAEIENRSY